MQMKEEGMALTDVWCSSGGAQREGVGVVHGPEELCLIPVLPAGMCPTLVWPIEHLAPEHLEIGQL